MKLIELLSRAALEAGEVPGVYRRAVYIVARSFPRVRTFTDEHLAALVAELKGPNVQT